VKRLRLLLATLALAFLSSSAFGQLVPVTVNLKQMFGTAEQSTAQVCVTLAYPNSTTFPVPPRVIGVGVIHPLNTQCQSPNSSGVVTFNLYGNDVIAVGGQTAVTYYVVEFYVDGQEVSGANYTINTTDSPVDLSAKAPLNNIGPIPTVAPTDAIYARKDGGNMPFTGPVTAPSVTVSGALSGGSASITGAVTAGSVTVTGALAAGSEAVSGAVTTQSINGDLWVGSGAGQYASMAACYAALTAGQACHVPAGWTETFAANLVLSKNQSGFVFHGNAGIFMGAFSITKASGIQAFIKGPATTGAGNAVKFNYTGSGIAFDIGDASADTAADHFENFVIDIQGATNSSSVIGMRLRRIQDSIFTSLLVVGTATASNQIGFALSDGGAGSFAGTNVWTNIRTAQVGTGMQLLSNANNNVITGSRLDSRNIGLDIQGGNGNIFMGLLEVITTAVNFGNSTNVFGNRIYFYGQGNTTDCAFGAAATGNLCDNVGAFPAAQVTVSGTPGTTNSIFNPYKYQIDNNGNVTAAGLITGNGGVTVASGKNLSTGRVLSVGAAPSCSVTGAGASATCSVFGTDSLGEIVIAAAGAGPAATGTLTITVSAGTLGSGRTICNVWPLSNATAWNARAEFQQTSTGNTGYVGNWDNNAAALVAANSYNVGYMCFGR
jgi:hypothetical protein